MEGNIGVGKTECALCLCEKLREKGFKATVVQEEAQAWEDGGDLADKSEAGSRMFAAYGALAGHLSRQNFVFSEAGDDFDILFVERHPTTTVDVFDESVSTRGLFEGVHDMSGSRFLNNPERTIYLKSNPHECFIRTQKRGRLSEKAIDEFTFETLSLKHDEMMTKRQALGGTISEFSEFSTSSHHNRIVAFLGY